MWSLYLGTLMCHPYFWICFQMIQITSQYYFQQTMIHSLFTVNNSGDVFLEKHWKSVISRSIVDYFFDAQVNLCAKTFVWCYIFFILQNKATNPIDIPPVIATPHHYLISIYRCVILIVLACIFHPGGAFQGKHLLCGSLHDWSPPSLCDRVPPPCGWHHWGLLLRVLRDCHQGQLCRCLWGPF